MKINTKEEWKEQARNMFRVIIQSYLNSYVETKSVRIVIAKEALPLYQNETTQTRISAFKTVQDYHFFTKRIDNVTEIYCYEKSMSFKNHSKCLEITENKAIDKISSKMREYYCKAFVEFLVANIEWK